MHPSIGASLLALGVVWGIGLSACALAACVLAYLDEDQDDEQEDRYED